MLLFRLNTVTQIGMLCDLVLYVYIYEYERFNNLREVNIGLAFVLFVRSQPSDLEYVFQVHDVY